MPIEIKKAIEAAKQIKETFKSPEFIALKEKVQSFTDETPDKEKADAFKELVQYFYPFGDLAEALLGPKGDATVEDIRGMLEAIQQED
jgi:hypothetical protein